MPITAQNVPSWAAFVWLAAYSAVSRASDSTLFQDAIGYDYASLAVAFAGGLLGGAGRTLITLCMRAQLVGNVRFVLLKDLIVALIGGGMAYLVIQGYNSWVASMTIVTLPPVISDLRLLFIVLAGASRGRWFGALDKLASEALDNARMRLRGNSTAALPEDPPSSVAAPLED